MPFFGICLGLQCAVIEFARTSRDLNERHAERIRGLRFEEPVRSAEGG